MELDGPDSVLQHYLLDVDNRLGDLTLVNYTQRLGVLIWLLRDVCKVSADNPVPVTKLEQVTVQHLRQCVQHLLSNPVDLSKHGRVPRSGEVLSESTVKSYIRVWKAFFNWCYQEELIDVNPVARLKFPKVPKKITPAFTHEHVERMLAVCDTRTPVGFRDYVILLLLLDTGVRVNELVSLRIADVDFQNCFVKVAGKGRREREIGIYPELSKLLWKYVHKYCAPHASSGDYLFTGRQGHLSGGAVQAMVKRVQHRSGLEDVEFHAHVFRHTHSKVYMDNGGDMLKLSRELGHSSIQVTKLYLEDFGSAEAHKDHDIRSPLSGVNFRKKRKGRREEG